MKVIEELMKKLDIKLKCLFIYILVSVSKRI